MQQRGNEVAALVVLLRIGGVVTAAAEPLAGRALVVEGWRYNVSHDVRMQSASSAVHGCLYGRRHGRSLRTVCTGA